MPSIPWRTRLLVFERRHLAHQFASQLHELVLIDMPHREQVAMAFLFGALLLLGQDFGVPPVPDIDGSLLFRLFCAVRGF